MEQLDPRVTLHHIEEVFHNEASLHMSWRRRKVSNEHRIFEGSLRDTRVTSREHRAFGAHGETANFVYVVSYLRRNSKAFVTRFEQQRMLVRKDVIFVFCSHRLDKDHSGSTLERGICSWFEKDCESVRSGAWNLLWKRVDVDGSGEIEIEEFSAFVLNNKNVKVADTYHL